MEKASAETTSKIQETAQIKNDSQKQIILQTEECLSQSVISKEFKTLKSIRHENQITQTKFESKRQFYEQLGKSITSEFYKIILLLLKLKIKKKYARSAKLVKTFFLNALSK